MIKLDEAEIVNKYAAQLLDIEDLYIEGKNNKFCPYFLERKKMVSKNKEKNYLFFVGNF